MMSVIRCKAFHFALISENNFPHAFQAESVRRFIRFCRCRRRTVPCGQVYFGGMIFDFICISSDRICYFQTKQSFLHPAFQCYFFIFIFRFSTGFRCIIECVREQSADIGGVKGKFFLNIDGVRQLNATALQLVFFCG